MPVKTRKAELRPAAKKTAKPSEDLTPEEQALVDWMNNTPEMEYLLYASYKGEGRQYMDLTVDEYNRLKEHVVISRGLIDVQSDLVRAAEKKAVNHGL